MKNLGAQIRQARKEAGLGLNDLSRLSHISNSYLSSLENEKVKNPTLNTLDRIASALGKTVLAEWTDLDPYVGLGERLRKLRQPQGWGQQALACMLGVDRSTYDQWETEDSHPPLQKLVALADIFGVSTDYLLGRRTSEGSHTLNIRRALEAAQEYIENTPELTKYQTLALIEQTLKSLPELHTLAGESAQGSDS